MLKFIDETNDKLEARIKELEADVDALVKTRGELLKENARLEAEVRRIHDALLQERKAAGGSAGRADDRSLRAFRRTSCRVASSGWAAGRST